MHHAKAFIAGMILPAFILPIVLLFAYAKGFDEFTGVLTIHMLPLIWGAWNLLYFAFCREFLPGNQNMRLMLAGGILGLFVAIVGVFFLDVPALWGIPGIYGYLPLIIAPVVYAFLWAYVVKAFDEMLGLNA